MVLTRIQEEVLALIARNRNPNNYVAGGTALNVDSERVSIDIDIFHDYDKGVGAVVDSYDADIAVLEAAGFAIQATRRNHPERGFAEVVIRHGGEQVVLQWVVESAFRFFPVIADDRFGFRLHPVDLAVNKVLALVGRQEPRDFYDLLNVLERGYDLGALVWAAPGKDPGLGPEFIFDRLTRNTNYSQLQFDALTTEGKRINIKNVRPKFLDAVDSARPVLATLPVEELGRLYLNKELIPVTPDQEAVLAGDIVLHSGSVGGAWPMVDEGLNPG